MMPARTPRPYTNTHTHDPPSLALLRVAMDSHDDATNGTKDTVIDLLNLSDSDSEHKKDNEAHVGGISMRYTRAERKARRLALNTMGSSIDNAIDLEDEIVLDQKLGSARLSHPTQINHSPPRDPTAEVERVQKEGLAAACSLPGAAGCSSSGFQTGPMGLPTVFGPDVPCRSLGTNCNASVGNHDGDNRDDGEGSVVVKAVHRIPRRCWKSCSGSPPRRGRGRPRKNYDSSEASTPSHNAPVDSRMSDVDTPQKSLEPVERSPVANDTTEGEDSSSNRYELSSEESSEGSCFEPPVVTRKACNPESLRGDTGSEPSHRLASPAGRSLRPRRQRREKEEDPVKIALVRPSYSDEGYQGGTDPRDIKSRADEEIPESGDTVPGIMTMVYRKTSFKNSLPFVEFAVHSAESEGM
jgi:hypothetical protein